MSRPLYGAIEAGGTKFVCAAGYGPTELGASFRADIPTSTPAVTLGAVTAFFQRLRAEGRPLAGIGVAAFGPLELDPRSRDWGRILATPKPGWSGVSLTEPLECLDCPIVIDTDVNAAALAEARLGAGLGVGSLAYVTVGTGIGGGLVIDGRSMKGMLHPEMGHILVRRDARDVDFGGTCPFHADCLEGLASGPALVARWKNSVESWPQGHPGLEITGGYLGQLAATLALMLSCERIVFGGGVMSSGRLLPFIREAAARQLNGYLPIEARAGGFERYIVSAALGRLAGLTGAMLLAGASPPA
ncbi:MAG: ROK family protein [Steroidobacteraceae bacterium]